MSNTAGISELGGVHVGDGDFGGGAGPVDVVGDTGDGDHVSGALAEVVRPAFFFLFLLAALIVTWCWAGPPS